MKAKKEQKAKQVKAASRSSAESGNGIGEITSVAELKSFLVGVRDKMGDQQAAPVYAMSAINHVMNLSDIYTYMDNETREIARDIWLRIKQAGFQVRTPNMLFSEEEQAQGN